MKRRDEERKSEREHEKSARHRMMSLFLLSRGCRVIFSDGRKQAKTILKSLAFMQNATVTVS